MTAAYTLAEASKKLPALFKKAVGNPVIITHQNKVVGYLVASGDMEARIETLEIMANPKAMKAIKDDRAGRTKYYPFKLTTIRPSCDMSNVQAMKPRASRRLDG